ncbi:hypothetical protein [Comamonas sp. JC664]|uniref:hypothetical protein n=1 Tax=Comamonas sp. JC664 TaxID=2801917 RepID=UPI00174B2F37|nr:hypothetical protein [Comamonas sp. JC664]MBL0697097.1 hypothetical protein [Comamonas sp. JC664]GHG82484.1 hypothetical protein GCM10012319_36630 [Comamonas sp. KCTC 72670]
MICQACARLRDVAPEVTCPECGASLVPATEVQHEALVKETLRRHIEGWRASALIDVATATRLTLSLAPDSNDGGEALVTGAVEQSSLPESPDGVVVSTVDAATRAEAWADGLATSLRTGGDWRLWGWGAALARSLDDAAKAERAQKARGRRASRGDAEGGEDDLGAALDSGEALFTRDGSGPLSGGLEAVVALDAGPESSPRFQEFIWWFLGAVLVLGGSLMGVREAWNALGGVPRQLLVTSALWGYHAGFIGLGVFLSKRSMPVGRVLSGIGLALLPVTFVALSSLFELSSGLGVAVALGVAAVGLVPLRSAGRLLHGTSVTALALALLPSLFAGLPLMTLDDAPWGRALCAGVGVVALAATAWRARRQTSGSTALVSASAALYGALWLAVFCVASGPSGFDALEPGSPLFAGLTLWAQALALVIAAAATSDAVRAAHPRASPVLETVAYAVLASGALAGAHSAFSLEPGGDFQVDLASVLAPCVAAGGFFLMEPRRRALVHLVALTALLGGTLAARTQAAADPGWWVLGGTVAASGLLLLARWSASPGLRIRLLAWGIVASLVAMPLVTRVGEGGTPWARGLTGLVIAGAAHLAGGWRWRGLHYLGGAGLLFGVLAFATGTPGWEGPWAPLAVFALLSGLYGAVGLAQAAWAQPAAGRDALLPLDDLSLCLAAAGVLLALGGTPVAPAFLVSASGLPGGVLAALPTALVTTWLLLRVRRDGSRLVAFLAASGFALAVSQVLGTVGDFTSPRAARVAASLALGFAVFSALRGRASAPVDAPASAPRRERRRLFDLFRLPWGAQGLPLFTDGFAAAALVLFLIATFTLTGWLFRPDDAERATGLLACGVLLLTVLVAFVSRGFEALRLRGSVVTLAALGGLIALTALVNRAGRPAPPDVVALRLPIIGVALWGLALATRRFGPWVAQRLERPRHGKVYHWVPHIGVALLACVLLKGAVWAGLPTPSRALAIIPPLMLLGPAVLLGLLAVSARSVRLASVGLWLGHAGAALWAARQSLLGPRLASLRPLEGEWVRAGAEAVHWLHDGAWLAPGDSVFLLWQRAFAGIAAAGLVYAAASLRGLPERFQQRLRHHAGISVGLVFLAALFQPGLTAAGLVLATGLVLFLGGVRAQGRLVLGASLLLLVHALAHRVDLFEMWPGPVLALVGLAVVGLGPWLRRRQGLSESAARVRIQQATAVYALAAVVYALATNGTPSSTLAALNLLAEAGMSLGGAWMVSPALPVTMALLASTLFVAAFQWKGALASLVATLGAGLTGATFVAALMSVLSIQAILTGPWLRYGRLFSAHGAALALAAAAAVVALHLAQAWARRTRPDIAGGVSWGRDAWLVSGGVMLAVLATGGSASEEALPLAIASLGTLVLVALHCAWSEHTGRHVYFVQTAVVGSYVLVRNLYAPGLRAEHDAFFALALGFILVGVTVLARRAGVQPVEAATRRFAALLPMGMALVLPNEATREAALLAGGSGLLYATLGAVERSRLFGAFAAAACNFALLIAALAFGLEGLEIYLAPVGLLLLMLGQLFSQSLPQAARNTVRILGGLLLYVPAAAKMAVQVGQSPDGVYALVFGGVCLLGVVAGMVFQIRAYLALGTLFLTLNVAATLLDAGLKDHRIGFLVMTLAGLTLIGGRVLTTLKRQEWEVLVRRVRVQLRGWD